MFQSFLTYIIIITSEIIKSSYCITTNQNLKISMLVRILNFAINV